VSFDPYRAYEHVKNLAYPRFTGTEGEQKARKYIVSTLKKYGYEVREEAFEVYTYEIEKAEFEVIEPFREKVECAGVGFTGCTPEEGVEADLKYIEDGGRRFWPRGEGHILLLATSVNLELYKDLMKLKPAAIVSTEESPARKPSHVEIPYEWKRHGTCPMIKITYDACFRLVRSGAKRARVVLLQREFKTTSYNIIAEKAGSKYPDEIILLCAHYDSVYGVVGALDNAGGTAILLELARISSEIDTKRTVRLAFFAAEELGLRGSLAYTEQHKDELEKIKLVVNFDVHGASIGKTSVIATGPENMKSYIEALSKELGIRANVAHDIMSSDGTPFADKGVPALNIFRSTGRGVYAHTVDDDLRYIGPEGFLAPGLLAESFIRRMVFAEEIPFKREIPENIKKKIDEYFEKRLGIREKKGVGKTYLYTLDYNKG